MITKQWGLTVAMMLIVGLALPAGVVVPVGTQPDTADHLCDVGSVEQFNDVRAGDYGASYVLCMRALGLSAGTGDGSYGPERELSRGQLASFLVRLWQDVLGNQCPTGASSFEDVFGSVHRPNIECLYNLGIAAGTTATTFGPGDTLKASQISRFLLRVYLKAGNTCSDGAAELETAVECLTRLRVLPNQTEGKGTEAVTRAQMAVYLIGLWHNVSGRGIPPQPPTKSEPTTMTVEPPEIRAAEVRMGIYPCCADLAHWQIPLELGWWDELNITITPNQPTYHYFTSSQEIIPWLEQGHGDVAQAWVPGLFPTLETFGQDIPPIHFTDIWLGYVILVAPSSDAKTALEFMEEGMSFREAAEAAVEQLVDKEIHIPPHSTVQAQYADAFFAYLPEWWEAVVDEIPALDTEGNPLVLLNRDGTPLLHQSGNTQPIRITSNDWRYYATPVYVDDPTIVRLAAVEGQIDFAMPYGGPTLVQMIRNGWDPLISFAMMYEHDAASQQAAIASATVGGTGLLARREWVEENKDLAYRVVSVANRVLAFLEDPETQYEGWKNEARLINWRRALSLEPEDIGISWDTIHPSFNWEDQEALWDLSLPSYHPETGFVTQIEQLKAVGVLSENLNSQAALEEFLLAKEIYYDLKGMQERSDALFTRAMEMDLSESRQAMVDQAQVFYDRYNFYDALRFLETALIGVTHLQQSDQWMCWLRPVAGTACATTPGVVPR
ncbi:MAG: S-layer homology domain-containing protein [bacterium]|nr:S-layer homology domain-containing protein [bacterium]